MSQPDVVIASAVRTPIGSFQGALASLSASDLGAVFFGHVVEADRHPRQSARRACALDDLRSDDLTLDRPARERGQQDAHVKLGADLERRRGEHEDATLAEIARMQVQRRVPVPLEPDRQGERCSR